MNSTAHTSPALDEARTAPTPLSHIDESCRGVLLPLFIASALWLLVSSAFGLIASIKFHGPNFLADSAWLTYGRVRPAQVSSLLYGFCIQAGTGVCLWLVARLGRSRLSLSIPAAVGVLFLNLGVAIGVFGILRGDATGAESLEFPGYSTVIVLIGYILLAVSAAATVRNRRSTQLYVSVWLILAALFWFAWIYSTGQMLVAIFPVRGMIQPVINWWFSENLQVVWFWFVGFGIVFYFVPMLLNRPLHSRYLALLTFWMLVLFGGWGGIPQTAPVPAWMPTMSAAARLLLIVTTLSIILNLYGTLRDSTKPSTDDAVTLRFIYAGLFAFCLTAMFKISRAFIPAATLTDFTWFGVADWQLNTSGFFSLVVIGAIYYIAPRLVGVHFSSTLVKVNWWLAVVGVFTQAIPLAVGGIVQGIRFHDPASPFVDIMRSTQTFLRVSTLGDTLILLGGFVLVINLLGTLSYYRKLARSALGECTADVFQTAKARS